MVKTMNTEQKAKAYDVAIERAKELLDHGLKDTRDKKVVLSFFPELKESKDERIRRNIIAALKGEGYYDCDLTNECIAWLEKQGEHVENNEDDLDTDFTIYHPLKNGKGHYECIPYSFYGTLTSFSEDKDLIDFLRLCFYTKEECNEWIKRNESADKFEHKFHEGQWIVWQNKCYKINYNCCGYELIDQNGLSTSLEYGTVDESAHLWIIQDAKDGDVLWHSDSASNGIFIFKEIRYDGKVLCYCDYDSEDHFCLGEHHTCCWSNAKYIHPATKEQRDTLFTKMREAGYEWDEKSRELKKIEQKHAWSEEDEEELEIAIDTLKESGQYDSAKWVQSLKQRIGWKPSEEQMDALNDVISSRDIKYDVLSELWKDLAKL